MSFRTERPTLSILLLCWNHARFLETCIASLAKQTSKNFDIVFLDNASTDGSAELASQLLSSTKLRFRVIRNDKARGISSNFNHLLAQSEGELVALLSTDDWYAPTYVETITSAANRYPNSALLAVNGWSVWENSGKQIPSEAPRLQNEFVGNKFLFDRDFFFWVGLCYRRAALVSIGGWDEAQPVEDMDLLYRLTSQYRVTQLTDRLVFYRRVGSSISLDPLFMANGRLEFFKKHRADFGRKWPTLVAEMLRSSAAVAIDSGKLYGAALLLVRSLSFRPLERTTWRTIIYLLRATFRWNQ